MAGGTLGGWGPEAFAGGAGAVPLAGVSIPGSWGLGPVALEPELSAGASAWRPGDPAPLLGELSEDDLDRFSSSASMWASEDGPCGEVGLEGPLESEEELELEWLPGEQGEESLVALEDELELLSEVLAEPGARGGGCGW